MLHKYCCTKYESSRVLPSLMIGLWSDRKCETKVGCVISDDSSRWSFGPNSAWCSIETTTIGKTRSAPLYIKKHDSSQILSRKERFFEFEEIKQGNLERECFEENCNDEERLEVFDNHEKDYKVKMIFEVCIKQRIRYLDFDRVIDRLILYIL